MASEISTPNSQYIRTEKPVKAVRDSIAGEHRLKSDENQQVYLPSPCPSSLTSEDGLAKYGRYINGAEYDNAPDTTLSSILGAITSPPPDIDLPNSVSYLEEDADGNKTTLNDQIKIIASEMLQMNYIGLLSEFSDLSSLDVDELSIQDVRDMQARSSIKLYDRESIVDWEFAVINGVLQLRFAVLKQEEEKTDMTSFSKDAVTSYLLLALDDDGYYFQRKYVELSKTGFEVSKDIYPQAGNQNLKEIPFDFAISDDVVKGVIPEKLGYIYPISLKALSRYRVSADLKESMYFNGAPSSWSSGWTKSGVELYKEMTGRSEVSVGAGAHIPLPKESEIGLLQWDSEGDAHFRYMEENAKAIRALGGSFDNTDGQDTETATARVIKTAEKKGVLLSTSSNLEQALQKSINWCAMFMGDNSANSVIKLNRDYNQSKMTTAEQKEVRDNFMAGLISREEALNQLEKGGILTEDASIVLNQAILTGDE